MSSLLAVSKSTRALFGLLLSETNVCSGQDQLLNALDVDQPITVIDLSASIHVRPSTISKMLDRLVDKGLVTRSHSDEDGRHTLVLLTLHGEKARAVVRKVWIQIEADLRKTLSDGECDRLGTGLSKADELLQNRLGRMR